MTNQSKHNPPKPKPAEPAPAPSHAPLAGKVFDEHKGSTPPAQKKIIECFRCFWGQDTTRGHRVCRGSTPSAQYMGTHGETTHSRGLWARVEDHDYCKDGEPL